MSLLERLRSGAISDPEFDEVFSPEVRAVSVRQWTPVRIARRAAQLLVEAGADRIVDVGSGPGKFCIIGALTTAAHFTGVEKRAHLVEEARRAAAELGADRAVFAHANVLETDYATFNGFYLYNPFYECIDEDEPFRIDNTQERSETLFKTYVAVTAAALIRAPVGTVVVTFHGFGGEMPAHYRCLRTEYFLGGELVLWVRTAEVRARTVARKLPGQA